ncbi:MAG: hypothetical protein ABI083_10740 [Lapillicoccus sp.]
MNGAKVGSLIGCCGGLAFYLINAGPLSGSWPLVVQILGVVLFVVVVGLVLRARVIGHGGEPTRGQLRAYGWTVIGEVAAIFIGSRVLVAVSDRTTVSLPWVAVVLGVHFVIFAPIFKEPVFAWFGVPIAVLGVVGLGLALADTGAATIGVVAGIIPGTIMFAAVAWSAWVGRPVRRPVTVA